MHGIVVRLRLAGCIMSAASTPSRAPLRAMSSLPPPRSSAGVPRTRTRPGTRVGERGEGEPSPDTRGCDEVVAARVTDRGERVVLGEQRDTRRPVGSELAREGGLEAEGASLDDIESRALEGLPIRTRAALCSSNASSGFA